MKFIAVFQRNFGFEILQVAPDARDSGELVAGADTADDPAGDDAGDLHHGDASVLALQTHRAPLVGLGGGIVGDLHGVPESRLAVIPGTSHTGLCDRAAWVVPMIEEFLSQGQPAC